MKRSTLSAVLLVACGGGLASMPTGPKPAWVGDGPIADYPDKDFIVGVGLTTVRGDDMQATQQAADAAARVELTKKLEVQVSSEFTSMQSELTKNGVTTETQSASDMTREVVQGFELEGVDVKTRWLDESAGVAYALAVWPKARAEAVLKAKLSDAEAEAKKAEAEGDKNSGGAALKQYLTARLVLDKAVKSAVLLRAVTGKPAPVPDAAPIAAKLDKLVAQIDVQASEGDGQRAKAHGALSRPLSVKATLAGAPLSGLPVAFVLPGGTIDARGTTDAAGLAQARVADVGDLASGEGRASARVDWAALGGGEAGFVSGLRKIEVGFQIVSRQLSTTRVLVKIIERVENAPGVTTGALQSALSNQFTGAGFGVRDGEALVARIPIEQLLTLDPASFQRQARDLADIVVIGEAAASYSSTLADDVVVHRARLNLRVVDLGSGQVIATSSLEAKGQPGKGPEKAGKKALEALAQSFKEDLPAKVRAQLGL